MVASRRPRNAPIREAHFDAPATLDAACRHAQKLRRTRSSHSTGPLPEGLRPTDIPAGPVLGSDLVDAALWGQFVRVASLHPKAGPIIASEQRPTKAEFTTKVQLYLRLLEA